MERAYYSDDIATFLARGLDEVLGELTRRSAFAVERTQRDAWLRQIELLQQILAPYRGRGAVFFEFSIPRLGRRIDVVAVVGPVVLVIEFKVGESVVHSHDRDQICDYALDLKNFHETSHHVAIAPILVATESKSVSPDYRWTERNDRLLVPIVTNADSLQGAFEGVVAFVGGADIEVSRWQAGRYRPTPTIIEAANALWSGHSVSDIARSDASAVNLAQSSGAIDEIIRTAKATRRKAICFVTGVPGAGKTLVGLNAARKHSDKAEELYSVFLSGNGPLVAILREALARDKVRRERETGKRVKKGTAMSEVKAFIQNVHHFRDECLVDSAKPPVEHVAIFDEAQRAWNTEQTAKFMLRKKNRPGFTLSEPEFLISCLDRHRDWAVIVCLVGGGQEINTGEAGISEWIEALQRSFNAWQIYISSRLTDSEYGAGRVLDRLAGKPGVEIRDELHLSVSMRSFRAEHVSTLVKQILDLELAAARNTLQQVSDSYPILLTRDLQKAKQWLKRQARGTERYGIVVSSEAQRLKPHAIDVRSPMDPVHWFLDSKADVRSSYYLEDVATEFHVQGLELDWACVTWDADFRFRPNGWEHWSFVGKGWNRIRKPDRQAYLKNAYRVLLTRARQGMVIVVPEGNPEDPTRNDDFYGPTFDYLQSVGLQVI
jgi:hypothetical protein